MKWQRRPERIVRPVDPTTGEPVMADATVSWLTAWGADAAIVFRTPPDDDGNTTTVANGIPIPDR